jgi:Kef-type K+ transport system membrane component KefB
LRTNLLGLSAGDFGWLAGILAIAILGKIVPVYLAARLSGMAHGEAAIFGSLMNTRGLMELIVLNIGYNLGFMPRTVFTMLVLMAVVTTLMTGPLLNVFLPKLRARGANVYRMNKNLKKGAAFLKKRSKTLL